MAEETRLQSNLLHTITYLFCYIIISDGILLGSNETEIQPCNSCSMASKRTRRYWTPQQPPADEPHRLVDDLDATLVKQVLDISQGRKRCPDQTVTA